MKSEDICKDWKTKSEHRVNEHLARNRNCHICGGGLIENSFINWHPEELEGCHKECRVVEPDPKAETGWKYYDNTDEHSDKKRSDKTAAREKTIYGQYYWNYDDEWMLEEMWKDGKSIEEIADALTRILPHGYHRSVGIVSSVISRNVQFKFCHPVQTT